MNIRHDPMKRLIAAVRFPRSTGLAILLACGVGAAHASGDLPREKTDDGVSYREGGFGVDEAQAMRRAAGDYPLMLSFADDLNGRHAYVADVDVTIRDHTGVTAFETVSAGPLLLVDLPAGTYDVNATLDNQTVHRQIEVQPQKTRRVYFEWNQPA